MALKWRHYGSFPDPLCSIPELTVPNLSIKGVPDPIAEALRARAARNHRSLQGELLDIVTRAAMAVELPQHRLVGLPETRSTDTLASGARRKTIDQIAAEHLRRFPTPLAAGPRAVDIVRRARDAK